MNSGLVKGTSNRDKKGGGGGRGNISVPPCQLGGRQGTRLEEQLTVS